jgi:hypothetical protein
MSDFEMVRAYFEDCVAPAEALDRIEAEVERLQRFIDSDTPGQCRDCPGGKNWEAEVETLRMRVSDHLKIEQELKTEVERLTADAEAWRWLMDNLPEGFDGDGAVEALIVERLAEANRMEAEGYEYAENARSHHAEVERLLKELDRMTGEARKWHGRAEENAIKCEKLLRRVEYLESEDA